MTIWLVHTMQMTMFHLWDGGEGFKKNLEEKQFLLRVP